MCDTNLRFETTEKRRKIEVAVDLILNFRRDSLGSDKKKLLLVVEKDILVE